MADNYTYMPYGQSDNMTKSFAQQDQEMHDAYEGNQGTLLGLSSQAVNTGVTAQDRQANQAKAATLGAAPQAQAAMGYSNDANNVSVGPTSTAAGPNVAQTGAHAQSTLMGQLQNEANGNGPSVADMQTKQAIAQGTAAQMGIAATQGGRNPAMANRQASVNAANIAQGAAGQAAQTKVQEQLAAQGQLGQVAGTVQGQNLGEATLGANVNEFNAGQANNSTLTAAQIAQQTALANQKAQNDAATQTTANLQQTNLANQNVKGQYGLQQGQFDQATALANLQAQQQQRQANDTYSQNMLGLGANISQQAEGNLAAEQTQRSNNYNTVTGINAGIAVNQQTDAANTLNGLIGMGSGLAGAAASDEDLKHDVKGAGSEVEDFLQTLGSPESWKYNDPKSPGQAKGTFVGPMAQTLEKSKASKDLVKDTPAGKMVDYARSQALVMAALGHLKKQVDGLKKAA